MYLFDYNYVITGHSKGGSVSGKIMFLKNAGF